jgi:hypothetical protein
MSCCVLGISYLAALGCSLVQGSHLRLPSSIEMYSQNSVRLLMLMPNAAESESSIRLNSVPTTDLLSPQQRRINMSLSGRMLPALRRRFLVAMLGAAEEWPPEDALVDWCWLLGLAGWAEALEERASLDDWAVDP